MQPNSATILIRNQQVTRSSRVAGSKIGPRRGRAACCRSRRRCGRCWIVGHAPAGPGTGACFAGTASRSACGAARRLPEGEGPASAPARLSPHGRAQLDPRGRPGTDRHAAHRPQNAGGVRSVQHRQRAGTPHGRTATGRVPRRRAAQTRAGRRLTPPLKSVVRMWRTELTVSEAERLCDEKIWPYVAGLGV